MNFLECPKELTDKNKNLKRENRTSSSYDIVIKQIKNILDEYKKKGINKKIGALPTVTRQSLSYAKEIIDEYIKLVFNSIHLRPTNKLGEAAKNWDKVGYSAEEFNNFWKESLD